MIATVRNSILLLTFTMVCMDERYRTINNVGGDQYTFNSDSLQASAAVDQILRKLKPVVMDASALVEY
jgi:hypothetical protein